MDQRQKRSRARIFSAFRRLLCEKSYAQITVQDIIDRAGIGRSTFYAHFDAKEALLEQLCIDMFSHISARRLSCEQTHDFSAAPGSLCVRLTHLLCHLQDMSGELRSLLADGSSIFLHYFCEYLSALFADALCPGSDARADFALHLYAQSFAGAVQWWFAREMQPAARELADWYLTLFLPGCR